MSHFQPLVEMVMKSVDENIDKRNKQWFGRVMMPWKWTFMVPKRRFWTAEQSVACAFLKYFSRCWSNLLGDHWLKARSNTHAQRFVRPSKILRLVTTNPGWHFCRDVQNGDLWSPNEDFGRLNNALCMHFWTSFQSVVAQNKHSHPWKSASKTHTQRFVQTAKIFVWGP